MIHHCLVLLSTTSEKKGNNPSMIITNPYEKLSLLSQYTTHRGVEQSKMLLDTTGNRVMLTRKQNRPVYSISIKKKRDQRKGRRDRRK